MTDNHFVTLSHTGDARVGRLSCPLTFPRMPQYLNSVEEYDEVTRTRGSSRFSVIKSEFDTLPKLLVRNATEHADSPAIRHKLYGIWQTWTWAKFRDEVRDLSIGLRSVGLDREDIVAIIGDNRPQIYAGIIATQSVGAIPLLLNPDLMGEELVEPLKQRQVKMAIVQGQEQVDKLIENIDRLPDLCLIIFELERGLENYDRANLMPLSDIQRSGRDNLGLNPGGEIAWLGRLSNCSGADTCAVLYTEGASGSNRVVSLTHDDVIKVVEGCSTFDKLKPNDVLLAYLPMAWMEDFAVSVGLAIAAAVCICCPESSETATENRREIGPTVFFAPPRLLESTLTMIIRRMADAGHIKKMMFEYFMNIAARREAARRSERSISIADRLRYWFGDVLVYGPIRDQTGLARSRIVYVIGGRANPELLSFYRSIGVNLTQRQK